MSGPSRTLLTLRHMPPLEVSVQFKSQDLWMGLYFENYPGKFSMWVCLLPMFPIHLVWWKQRHCEPERSVREPEEWRIRMWLRMAREQ